MSHLSSSSSSSILQAIPLFEAYWLGISIFRHDPTRASLLTRHSAAPHYNASIALVDPTGGDIGTIHVQVQLVVRWRRHRSQSLSVFVKGLDNRYCYIPRRQDLLDARGWLSRNIRPPYWYRAWSELPCSYRNAFEYVLAAPSGRRSPAARSAVLCSTTEPYSKLWHLTLVYDH